jgi:DNA-binding IscR family transcriptional regulator
MMRLEGAERLILQAILGLQGDSRNYVADSRIAEETDLALDDVRNWFLTLQDKELVSIVRGRPG